MSRRTANSAGLARQIAVRLAILALIFALINAVIVLYTYAARPEALADRLLTLEAETIARRDDASLTSHPGPPGATAWAAYFVDEADPALEPGVSAPPDDLVDWTRREKINGGFRLSGIRTVEFNGARRWLFMTVETRDIESYWPVIGKEILEHAVFPMAPLAVLLLLFNIAAVNRVLVPLHRAESELDAIGKAAEAPPLSVPEGPREVKTLVRAVNNALSRQKEAMEILRSFTANAAHELRTPLAIMQLTAGKLPDSAVRRDLQSDLTHMARLVSQMLDLAQADGMVIGKLEEIDLAEVGREVVAAIAPMALAQGRSLKLSVHGASKARALREAIYRTYRNLIENALAHSDAASPIEIDVGPGPMFSVRDFGPGIPDEDKARIFERFWRKDKNLAGGAGLGLGIVKRLVEMHGGSIEIADGSGGGALFTVRLP